MSGPNLNSLYYGDCLDWMSRWDDSSVDLIYLDPPFNSNANYNILYSSEGGGDAQFRAFSDTWYWDAAAADRIGMYENATGRPAHGVIVGLHRMLGSTGMLAYLTYMAERLEQMHRLIKPTGSIYLHCDPTASHYLKLILDAIFGAKHFRNEIVWCYSRPSAPNQRQLSRVHDIVFWYSKGSEWTFNPDAIRQPYAASSRAREGYGANASKVADGTVQLDGRGKFPESWIYIPPLKGNSKEHLGYPTQKPITLLNRIISASSNKGDVVLDPFCGCGTAIDAAHRLDRRWVGIDISSFAIDLIRNRRLQNENIPTQGIPYDLQSARKLASEQPFSFESWAVTRIPGFVPNTKQTADGGVDGRATLASKPDNYDSRLAVAQIKGGKFSLSALRDFIGVMNRDRAALGCFVTLKPVGSQQSTMEVANTGKVIVSGQEYRRMQIWPIAHYFEQRLPNLPLMRDPYSGKPMNQYFLF